MFQSPLLMSILLCGDRRHQYWYVNYFLLFIARSVRQGANYRVCMPIFLGREYICIYPAVVFSQFLHRFRHRWQWTNCTWYQSGQSGNYNFRNVLPTWSANSSNLAFLSQKFSKRQFNEYIHFTLRCSLSQIYSILILAKFWRWPSGKKVSGTGTVRLRECVLNKEFDWASFKQAFCEAVRNQGLRL